MARITIALIGFIGAFFISAWISLIAIIILALFWRSWEAIFLGLLVDFLWLPPHAIPWFTTFAIVIVWILEPIRREFLSR